MLLSCTNFALIFLTKTMMAPSKSQLEGAKAWSGRLESVRKDIEGFFGILRKRFCILRDNFRLHDFEILVATFHMCCWIQNEILDLNQYDDSDYIDGIPDRIEADDLEENFVEDPTINQHNLDDFLYRSEADKYKARQEKLIHHSAISQTMGDEW